MKNPVKIGFIAAAHGIRGEVKIRSLIEPPEAIFACGVLSDTSGKRQFTLSKKGGNEKGFIAAIAGIADRNAAELLKGTELYAPSSALPKKKKGDFYAHELIGLEARLEDGRMYGRVAQLYNFGAGDILEIELCGGGAEMLPLLTSFIEVKSGYILVHPAEYAGESEE